MTAHPSYHCKAPGHTWHDLTSEEDGTVSCANAGCEDLWKPFEPEQEDEVCANTVKMFGHCFHCGESGDRGLGTSATGASEEERAFRRDLFAFLDAHFNTADNPLNQPPLPMLDDLRRRFL